MFNRILINMSIIGILSTINCYGMFEDIDYEENNNVPFFMKQFITEEERIKAMNDNINQINQNNGICCEEQNENNISMEKCDNFKIEDDKYTEEKAQCFISYLFKKKIYSINDKVLESAIPIFGMDGVKKLLLQYTKDKSNIMDGIITKCPYSIDENNILDYFIYLPVNIKVLDNDLVYKIYKLNSKLKNTEVIVKYNEQSSKSSNLDEDNEEMNLYEVNPNFGKDKKELHDLKLVGVFIKQDVLIDRIHYTFMNNDNIALTNMQNIVYLINSTKVRGKYLLMSIEKYINEIDANNIQFLRNFKYLIKYINQSARNSIKSFINSNPDKFKNNNTLKKIVEENDKLDKLQNKNDTVQVETDVLHDEWDVIFYIIFANKNNCIKLITNAFTKNDNVSLNNKKIIIHTLNSNNIPMSSKVYILTYFVNMIIDYISNNIDEIKNNNMNISNHFLLRNLLYHINESTFYLLLDTINYSISNNIKYANLLKINIINILCQIMFHNPDSIKNNDPSIIQKRENFIWYVIRNVAAKKQRVQTLFDSLNIDYSNEYTQSFVDGIIKFIIHNNILNTSNDSILNKYINNFTEMFPMLNYGIKKLFQNKIQKLLIDSIEQVDSNKRQYLIKLMDYFSNTSK